MKGLGFFRFSPALVLPRIANRTSQTRSAFRRHKLLLPKGLKPAPLSPHFPETRPSSTAASTTPPKQEEPPKQKGPPHVNEKERTTLARSVMGRPVPPFKGPPHTPCFSTTASWPTSPPSKVLMKASEVDKQAAEHAIRRHLYIKQALHNNSLPLPFFSLARPFNMAVPGALSTRFLADPARDDERNFDSFGFTAVKVACDRDLICPAFCWAASPPVDGASLPFHKLNPPPWVA